MNFELREKVIKINEDKYQKVIDIVFTWLKKIEN